MINYNSIFQGTEPEEGSTYRFFRLLSAFEQISKTKPREWLDLGCHNGGFLEMVYRQYKTACYGVDDWLPEGQQAKGIHECKFQDGTKWKYQKSDLGESLGFKGPFEVISALEVIEHIIDTDRFLISIHKTLKAEGYLLISTPNINNLRNRVRVPFGMYPIGIEYKNVIHHVRLYNVACLISHLKEHGFVIRKIFGVQMLPRRFTHTKFLRILSESLADRFPQFCPNILCIAQKK